MKSRLSNYVHCVVMQAMLGHIAVAAYVNKKRVISEDCHHSSIWIV